MATPAPTARRTYLTERLVRKQITMEEATELFTLMTREMERMRRQGAPAPPPAPSGRAPPPPPGWVPPGRGGVEYLDELLLYGGPLLGILAALIKRSGVDVLSGLTGSSPSSPAPPPAEAPLATESPKRVASSSSKSTSRAGTR